MDFNIYQFLKNHLIGGSVQGIPRTECRICPKHPTVLQTYETTSVRAVNRKGAVLTSEISGVCKNKVKINVCRQNILVDIVVSKGCIG